MGSLPAEGADALVLIGLLYTVAIILTGALTTPVQEFLRDSKL